MGLKDAPTYWPSDKEWSDPLGYIQSIADEGKKFGIIKVPSHCGLNLPIHTNDILKGYPTQRMETAILSGYRSELFSS